MTTQTEALKLALEALLDLKDDCSGCEFEWTNDYPLQAKALQAIDKVLAQQCVCGEPNSSGTHRTDGPCLAPQPEHSAPHGEPVAFICQGNAYMADDVDEYCTAEHTPLYTTPPQRTWVGLTDEDEIDWEEGGSLRDLVKAIEAKLKEENT